MPLSVLYTTPQKVGERFCVTVTYARTVRVAKRPTTKDGVTIKGEFKKDKVQSCEPTSHEGVKEGQSMDFCCTPAEKGDYTLTITTSENETTTLTIAVEG